MMNPIDFFKIQRRFILNSTKSFRRVPEKTVMDTESETRAYNLAGSLSMIPVYRVFTKIACYLLPERPHNNLSELLVADFGSGPGNLLIMMARTMGKINKKIRFLGSDLSKPMIDIASENIASANLDTKISVLKADCTKIEFVKRNSADLSTSLWVTHQFRSASHVIDMIRLMNNLTTINGSILLMDFVRPPTEELVKMVVKYTGSGIPENDKNYINSLKASFSFSEWNVILEQARIRDVKVAITSPIPLFIVIYRMGENTCKRIINNSLLPPLPENFTFWNRFNSMITQFLIEMSLRNGGFFLSE
ncbi:MAG: class I SAM-dependent methyltransferase [Candidatus Aenigmarchaeota archaeon]|nr:class I SAM-dependent methyltransferase [Candidatus Aenigmarchaeota archaeon]